MTIGAAEKSQATSKAPPTSTMSRVSKGPNARPVTSSSALGEAGRVPLPSSLKMFSVQGRPAAMPWEVIRERISVIWNSGQVGPMGASAAIRSAGSRKKSSATFVVFPPRLATVASAPPPAPGV